jgi:hypothetical protein
MNGQSNSESVLDSVFTCLQAMNPSKERFTPRNSTKYFQLYSTQFNERSKARSTYYRRLQFSQTAVI